MTIDARVIRTEIVFEKFELNKLLNQHKHEVFDLQIENTKLKTINAMLEKRVELLLRVSWANIRALKKQKVAQVCYL